jgi:hypothetical protein
VARINWSVSIGGTSFTTITQSLSFNAGRSSWFDTPSGNSVTLTVRNQTGQAAALSQGDQIVITNDLSAISMYFYVVEVTFQDEIAANADTATITGTDALGMLSLFYVNDDPIIGTTNAIRQAIKLANEVYPFVPPYPPPVEVDGRATVSDAFDPTTIGQRIVELLQTENSTYYYDGATIEFRTSAAPGAALFNFNPDGTVGIRYDSLTRKYPNANYPNVVNLTSTVAGTTQAVATGNYERNYNRQVLFNTVAQQQAQTDYFAAVLSDDSQVYMDLRFNDSTQTDVKMGAFLNELSGMCGKWVTVVYTPPGGSPSQVDMVIEGYTVSAIPGRTEISVSMSPEILYDLFTLNSSTFGILNTNRLGW